MSNAVVGKSGKVIFSNSEVVAIKNWKIDRNTDAVETSSMSSGGNRSYKGGMKDWGGSFETNEFVDLAGQTAVGSFSVGTAAATSTPIFSGTVIITNAPVDAAFDGVVAYAHTFKGSGPCAVTTT